MDVGIVAAALGALVGVALGALLTYLAQKALLERGHVLACGVSREDAYVEYLGAYRQFRTVLLTQEVAVRLVPRDDDASANVAVVDEAASWEVVEQATARLLIVAADNQVVLAAATAVRHALKDIAKARATCRPGAVPTRLVKQAKDAEIAFARVAQADLGR
ncbi:hypothetical protein V2J56_14515 [Georgenia sp. MJ206]|uniref:hypothetical protein n=1 Tax=Georgenia wangjunii TaxID=3117730 RepID=UPI002F269480